MSKHVLGFLLIDAPSSALNNAGQDQGSKTDNAVVVKTIKKGRSIYPYVSGQAWRYWWRQTLDEKFGWNMSPIVREAKVAFTSANPFEYPDDDVFGYMRALKKNLGGTLTRLSPLKNSPLISVYEQTPTNDFGVMSRQIDGDPVPFEHQFYSTILKGIFSLDLENIGKFGEIAKTGFKNLDKAYTETDEIKKSIAKSKATKQSGIWELTKEERTKRAKNTLEALPFLYSTTKSSGHLTDVTPKFVVLAVIDGGNHIFMNITNESIDKPINIEAINEVIKDYKDLILSDIFIGRQEGFINSCKDELTNLKSALNGTKVIHLLSPKQAIESFVNILPNYVN